MLGNLYGAFGVAVLCLLPISIAGLIIPPFILGLTKPKSGKRNPVQQMAAYIRWYVTTLVVLFIAAVVLLFGVFAFGGTEAVQQLAETAPINAQAAEQVIEQAGEVQATQNAP